MQLPASSNSVNEFSFPYQIFKDSMQGILVIEKILFLFLKSINETLVMEVNAPKTLKVAQAT